MHKYPKVCFMWDKILLYGGRTEHCLSFQGLRKKKGKNKKYKLCLFVILSFPFIQSQLYYKKEKQVNPISSNKEKVSVIYLLLSSLAILLFPQGERSTAQSSRACSKGVPRS